MFLQLYGSTIRMVRSGYLGKKCSKEDLSLRKVESEIHETLANPLSQILLEGLIQHGENDHGNTQSLSHAGLELYPEANWQPLQFL